MSTIVLFLACGFASLPLITACRDRLDATDYARRLVEAARPDEPEPLRLPRRLMGEVYLTRGNILGLEGFKLIEEPVTVVCYNATLGAIQPKFKAENVSVVYEWVYGENESWGRAVLAPQDLYIDIDVEKDSRASHPELLALYVSEPVDNLFKVTVLGGKDHSDADQIPHHIQLVTKMAFSRDARLTLTYDIAPRVEAFLANSDFSIV